jgi:outer membrane protein TolC
MSLPLPGTRFVLALLLIAGALPPRPASAEPLTLADALLRAEAMARSVRAKDYLVESARYQHHAALADLGPKVNLGADYQRWDTAIKFKFELPKDLPPEYQPLAALFDSGESTVRAQDTYTASVNVVQPITPLLTLGFATHLAKLNVEQARIDAVLQRRKVRIQVIDTFYGVLRLRAAVATLEALDTAASQHLAQAERFEAVGLLKKDDVLRIRVQLETLRQNLDLARTGSEVQTSSLALQIGMPVNSALEPVESAPPAEVSGDLDACMAEALAKRAEIAQVRTAIRMAEAARNLKATTWVPTVSGLFNYSRTTASQFSNDTSWFVGLSAQWTPWDWGKTFFTVRAAHADLLAARQSAGQVEDLVRLEVKANWLAAQTAKAGIERSGRSVEQSRENLRIQLERSKQSLNTTTDVLDAEALVLQAETDAASAGYGWRVALEKLHDSMGR